MENKNASLRSSMNYGLILGLALIALSLIQYIMDIYNSPAWVSILNYAFFIGVIFYGTKKFRDDVLGGSISYGKAVGFGVLISLFASIIFGFFFYLLVTFIDPDYMANMMKAVEEMYLEKGMSEDQVEMAMKMVGKMQTPLLLMISSIFGFVLMGTFFSLITSAFIKKEKPLFD